MKMKLLSILIILFVASCKPQQKVTVVTEERTEVTVTERDAETSPQKKVNPYKLIVGKWKMESYQVYGPEAVDPTDEEDITWEFNEEGDVIYQSMGGKTASMNTGKYMMNESIIKVNGRLYMYYFEDYRGLDRLDDAKPFGDELWLDSNLDPSISNHGPMIYFTRVR